MAARSWAASTPKPSIVGVVVDHQPPVPGAMDVELDPVGAVLPGQCEGLQGVLPGPAGRAAVTEHEGTRS